jgi:competence protein ComEC
MLGVVSWGSALATFFLPGWLVGVLVLLGAVLVVRRRRLGELAAVQVAWLLAGAAVAASVLLNVAAVAQSPVAGLARAGASVHVVLEVRSDPVLKKGKFSTYVMFRAQLSSVIGRGSRYRVRAPVLVIADADWRSVRLDSRIRAVGRLDAAESDDLAAMLATRGPPSVLDRPARVFRVADRVRAGIRAAVASQPAGPRALVPALVDGDGGALPDDIVADFRASGLTHLIAVSGTNLTLVVGFVLIVARWIGVRARGLIVVGALGVVGFVLLARAEPSVVRAAAMGAVALIGMGSGGRERGTRALGVAVFALMLFDPWLATSVGFALSACATAGILLLGPSWRDALMRWLPQWVAEAIAVPLAAQLACTPLVAAISGQVSIVAVLANLLAAVAVGPATVLGLVGGLVAVVARPVGQLIAAPGAWCAWWIIMVAKRTASLPVAVLGWSTSARAIIGLTLLCLVLALVLGSLLARRGLSVGIAAVLLAVMLVPLPTPGWPPPGWILVACDVGQGDGLVLNAGNGAGVVVDTGPDPALMNSCLRRLRITSVPLVVLTHFHADHVDGLSGVLEGRRVGGIEVTTVADPEERSRFVRGLAERAGVPVQEVTYGETRTVGPLHWQVLAPSEDPPPESDSRPNDASIVLYVETRGIRILMMGDEEPPTQKRLARLVPDLKVDVLKVAHHGSRYQDAELIAGLGAKLALISDGVGNDYGHPAPETIRMLERDQVVVKRTDTDGDLAVIVDHGLRVRTRMPRPPPSPGA